MIGYVIKNIETGEYIKGTGKYSRDFPRIYSNRRNAKNGLSKRTHRIYKRYNETYQEFLARKADYIASFVILPVVIEESTTNE